MVPLGTKRGAKPLVWLTALAIVLLAAAAMPVRANYGVKPGAIVGPQLISRPNAQVPLDATFKNEEGQTVSLASFFSPGRPVILVPVYYNCTSLCTTTLNELIQGIADGPRGLVLGRDYRIVAISINPEERPDIAAGKRKSYLAKLGQPDLVGGWHFLTGEETQIRRVTDEIGFHYVKDLEKGYDHARAIYILTPAGRVAATITNPSYIEPEVSLYDQLMNASQGKIGSSTIAFFAKCGLMKFDPLTGRYVYNPWMWAATIGGLLIFTTVAIFLGSLWVGEYKRAKLARQQNQTPPAPPATPVAGI